MSAVEDLLESAVGAIGGSTRTGQTEMADAVASAVDKGVHLLVQAGTGTGKSLAYLVPAAEYSSRTGNRVIVSTATLALQTQIIHRDLPRLFKSVKKTLDPLPRAALLKGRRNYVCKHKLGGGYPDEGEGMLFDRGADAEAGRKPNDRSGLGEEIQRIRTWEKTTDTGDRDDLLPGVSDRAWSQVSVNAFDCLGSNCPLYTECFAELARNNAAEADIVVTNHALLAIDAFGENTVLPEHDVIIIDEAHELKDRVTNALSGQINTSMLSAATSSVRKHTIVQDGVVALLDSAAAALERAQSGVSEGLVMNMSEALSLALAQIRDSSRQIINDIGGKTEDSDAGRQMAKARCQEIFDLAERFCSPGKNDVVWLSRSTFRERETTNLVVAPLSVAGTMRSGIFEESTVVATSATLSLGGNFDAVAASLGLFGPDAPKWDSLDVGSP
ncbi:MAG: ATP-dependent DNA helicase, partial [Brevibacterium sp.]|nr:ATP-dependent DNA helicase [Brevibacterium sp.]